MSQYEPKFDLNKEVGHSSLYSMVQCFALYLKAQWMYKHNFWNTGQYVLKFDLKINVGDSELHFTVQ